MFGTCCATAFTVTLVAASPLLGRLVTVALLADTLLMVPEWLGPVVRISLGWFGREVSHVGESVQGQRLLTAVRHGGGLGGLGLAKPPPGPAPESKAQPLIPTNPKPTPLIPTPNSTPTPTHLPRCGSRWW